METTSPPVSPIRMHTMSPIDTSPSPSQSSYRTHLRRRTSSFSSNHDRSPVTPKSRHRFSNASQLSVDLDTPHEDVGSGFGGNLADELDQLDDDEEFEEGAREEGPICEGEEQSRDSGIDVSYAKEQARLKAKASGQHVRNFSRPLGGDPPDEEEEEDAEHEDKFSPDLEDLINTIARMTSYTSTTEDPLIPRTIQQLQDLGNQSGLEAAAHRYTTATNSLASHLNAQTKMLQTLAQSLYPMFAGFASPLDPQLVEETLPLLDVLKDDIPQADPIPGQKLQKSDRETSDVIATLAQLTDTLQMGKQITNSAARHLRTTQTMVADLRREREQADLARHELSKTDWNERLAQRWCGRECKDIVEGFERRCDDLRGELEAVK